MPFVSCLFATDFIGLSFYRALTPIAPDRPTPIALTELPRGSMASNRVLLSVVALSLSWSEANILSAQETPVRTKVELCDLRVPDSVAQANATFTMVFSAVRSADGSLKDIKKTRGSLLPDAPFIACITGWKLSGPASEVVVVEFDWVHSKGWTAIRVLSKSSIVRFRIAPGAVGPYRRGAEKE